MTTPSCRTWDNLRLMAVGLVLVAFDLSLVNAQEVQSLGLSWSDRVAITGRNLDWQVGTAV